MQHDIEKLTTDLAVRAQGLIVTDTESLNRANEIILVGKSLIKTIKEFFQPMKAAAQASLDQVRSKEKAELDKVEPVVKRLGDEGAAYLYQEREKRRRAEEETRRVEAERKRNEDEALACAREAETRALNAKTAAERKEAEAEANAIMAKAAVQEEKIVAAAPVIPQAVRVQDQTLRDNWTFDVIDEALIPREYLVPDFVKIGKVVRVMKAMTVIPGIRPYNKPSMMRTS